MPEAPRCYDVLGAVDIPALVLQTQSQSDKDRDRGRGTKAVSARLERWNRFRVLP